jgi:hypothetical protein
MRTALAGPKGERHGWQRINHEMFDKRSRHSKITESATSFCVSELNSPFCQRNTIGDNE